MSELNYRRATTRGGTFFFTVTLADRRSDALVRNINHFRASIKAVKLRHPFEILGMVVLPDHLHAVWRLPEGDANFPMRWALIKSGFSRRLPCLEGISPSRLIKQERGIWQRRYWEHVIRGEDDLRRHIDYIHYNPVKHGLVRRASDWPYSTVHRLIARGDATIDWGGDVTDGEDKDFGERCNT